MENKLIVRIAEGLGNQLFMYAHGYALSKRINYDFFIDSKSAYFKYKNIRKFELDNFNITAKLIDDKEKFDNYFLDLKRKFLKKIDIINPKKKFLIEKRNNLKSTKYYEYEIKNFSNKVYVEGYFESEFYFKNFKNDLRKEFSLKNFSMFKNNKYYNNISNNKKVVSICIRQHRYSERLGNYNDQSSITKSNKFTQDTIEYIHRAVSLCEKRIDNPIFYIWSNDFSNLREYFNNKKFFFVENIIDKSISDFYLLNECKNFIVGPTSFHWWPAWLNYDESNLIIRPRNLNPSNNCDFWPKSWISI